MRTGTNKRFKFKPKRELGDFIRVRKILNFSGRAKVEERILKYKENG